MAFTKKTVITIAQRTNYLCSKPECGALTSGPNSDPTKSTIVGEAAHICGEKLGSARHNSKMTKTEIQDEENGIWLCLHCHKIIDRDETKYPPKLLRFWREKAEARVEIELGRHDPLAKNRLAEGITKGLGLVESEYESLDSRFEVVGTASRDNIHFQLNAREPVSVGITVYGKDETRKLLAAFEDSREVKLTRFEIEGSELLKHLASNSAEMVLSPLTNSGPPLRLLDNDGEIIRFDSQMVSKPVGFRLAAKKENCPVGMELDVKRDGIRARRAVPHP